MTKPTLLLEAHLKALRLPTFLREYDKVARHCAQEGLDCSRYLFRLCELELLDREQRATERRSKAAKFPVLKSLETFEFRAIPSVNKRLVLELTRSEYLDRRENVLALGNSGTGKTHLALALGLAACQKGSRVRFTTAAALVNELLEARDDKRLLRVQKQLAKQDLLIVDELGYVPLSKTGAELLFEIFSQRYEQASTLVTSNLPFNEWTEIFGSERLTGALLDRLTHHVHILELNGESYRLEHSKKARQPTTSALQRMDRDLRLRTADGRAARSADASRPHPGAERRELSPRTQQESPPARGRSGILKLPPATPLSGTPTHCQMV